MKFFSLFFKKPQPRPNYQPVAGTEKSHPDMHIYPGDSLQLSGTVYDNGRLMDKQDLGFKMFDKRCIVRMSYKFKEAFGCFEVITEIIDV